MKIVVASSEVFPFAKTGGLADVCGALPVELRRLGHEAIVFLPAYSQVWNAGPEIHETHVEVEVPIGGRLARGRVLESRLPDSDVPVFLVQQPEYFDRPGIYGEDGRDYPDNCARFVFFCRAVLEMIRIGKLNPDLVHANDWQTGLLPVYLKTEYSRTPGFENAASLFTIHNLAYQGRFWHWDMLLTGLEWKLFNWQELEFHGELNLLKAGIVFADQLSTVSPTYAREIQTPEHGCGLDGVLRHRTYDIHGILNGIDASDWNAETDPHLAANYGVGTWRENKPVCKAALQEQLGLEVKPDVPLIGIVGRLASQKGWSLILPVMRRWLESRDVQWVILGTGDPAYHDVLESLSRNFPHKLAARLEFSNALAHQIEAGSDIFVMPSEYEPCGLNQMYSMAYGTIPVVRTTGGLADTVVNCDPEAIESRTANGFSFSDFTPGELESALARCVRCYFDDKEIWQQLVETGMSTDWSWAASANRYIDVYERCRAAFAGIRR